MANAVNIRNNQQAPLFAQELAQLQEANTSFASPEQKQYIETATLLNEDNVKLDGIANTVYGHIQNGDLSDALSAANDNQSVETDETTQADTLRDILRQYPNQFGFNIANTSSTIK